MGDADLGRLDDLFHRVRGLAGPERAALLDRECADDPELRARIERMLATEEEADAWFDRLGGDVRGRLNEELLHGRPARERIGPYRIVSEIGQGGMGRVYLAERDDGQFEQRVALKVLRRGADGDLVRERFLVERRIVSRLEHPGIARLFDGGITEDGYPYAVMEYVEGEHLVEHCDRVGLGLRARLDLFLQVAGAVEFAHRNLVVHRDLKPSNVLVDEHGRAKLLDFGIAKLLDGSPVAHPDRTRTGVRMLTTQYAAPEQVTEGPASTAVDVYGLGTLLYELTSGERAFELGAGGRHELERRIVEQDPVPPSAAARRSAPDRAHALRGDLDAICMRALRKRPEERYGSAAALADDVRAYLAGRPVAARRGSRAYHVLKYVRRNRVALTVAAGVIAVAIAAAVLLAQESIRTAREKDRADRVTELFVDLFQVADPTTTRGEEITAREVLDAGAERVETQLSDQPEVAAALLEAMGRVYHNLGLYDRALGLLDRSVQLYRGLDDQEDGLVRSLDRLGQLYRDRGEYPRSETALREAAALAELRWGAHAPRTAAVRNSLARSLYSLGELEAAQELFASALADFEAAVGDWRAERAESLSGLGRVRFGRGEFVEAEPFFEQALALRQEVLGPDDILVAEAYNHLGSVRAQTGQAEAARDAYSAALEIRRRTLGPAHPRVADTLNGLAMIHRDLGDRETAEAMLRESIEIQRAALEADHPSLAQALSNLGLVLQETGRLAEAGEAYDEALAIRRAALGDSHVLVAHTYNNIGMLEQLRGRLEPAEENLRRARALLIELLGENHPYAATTANNLAAVLHAAGREVDAEALYREALAIRREALPADHPHIAYALVGLGRLLLETDRPGAARVALEEALEIRSARFPADSPPVAEARELLLQARAAPENGR